MDIHGAYGNIHVPYVVHTTNNATHTQHEDDSAMYVDAATARDAYDVIVDIESLIRTGLSIADCDCRALLRDVLSTIADRGIIVENSLKGQEAGTPSGDSRYTAYQKNVSEEHKDDLIFRDSAALEQAYQRAQQRMEQYAYVQDSQKAPAVPTGNGYVVENTRPVDANVPPIGTMIACPKCGVPNDLHWRDECCYCGTSFANLVRDSPKNKGVNGVPPGGLGCYKCSGTNPADARYCRHCGASLDMMDIYIKIECPACHKVNAATNSKCGYCACLLKKGVECRVCHLVGVVNEVCKGCGCYLQR